MLHELRADAVHAVHNRRGLATVIVELLGRGLPVVRCSRPRRAHPAEVTPAKSPAGWGGTATAAPGRPEAAAHRDEQRQLDGTAPSL